MGLIIHGDDIFYRGDGLQGVAGGEDITGAVRGEDIDVLAHFRAHFLRGAEGENALILHRAVEAKLCAELSLQGVQFHARAVPLYRVEDVDAHFDEIGQEGTDGAVVVVQHFDAEFVTEIDKPLHVRAVELTEGVQTDERAVLAAEIIGELRHVDTSLARLKDAPVMLVEEIAHALQQVAREIRVIQRVEQRLLQSAQQVVVIKRRHIPALHGVRLPPGERPIAQLRVIKPIRRGPWVGRQLVDGRHARQRKAALLVIHPGVIAHRFEADPPEIHPIIAGILRNVRADIGQRAGGREAIDMQLRQHRLPRAEMLDEQL